MSSKSLDEEVTFPEIMTLYCTNSLLQNENSQGFRNFVSVQILNTCEQYNYDVYNENCLFYPDLF